MKLREVLFYTIVKNILILIGLVTCFIIPEKSVFISIIAIVGIFSSIVRDPKDKIINYNFKIINLIISISSLIYIYWFYFEITQYYLLIEIFLKLVAVLSTFFMTYIFSNYTFNWLKTNILRSDLVQSVIKSYYAQLARGNTSNKYYTKILCFLNFIDKRPFLVEKKTIQATFHKLPFENIHFKDTKLIINRAYNYNCYYERVNVEGKTFREIHFNKCKIHKINLDKVKKVNLYKDLNSVFDIIVNYNKISLLNINPEEIDQYSIRKIKQFLKANNLELNDINADKWIKENHK
jgi:hypothetical protein